MIIILKNKIISIGDYKLKCAIGKRGTTSRKKEGDLRTPRGSFTFLKVYYRADRIHQIQTKIKKYKIKKDMGWCDDIKSKDYNKLIKLPSSYNFEKFYRVDNIYDIIIVINYNTNPIRRNKGSAIFIHIAKKKYKPTKGCIALSKKDILFFLKTIKKNDKIKII